MNRSGSLRSWEGLEEEEEPTSVTEAVTKEENTEDSFTHQGQDHKDDLPISRLTEKDKQLGAKGEGSVKIGQGDGGSTFRTGSNDHLQVKNLPQAERETDRVEEEVTEVKMIDGKEGKDEIGTQKKDRLKEEEEGEKQPPLPKEHQESVVMRDTSKNTQDTGPETKGPSEEPGLSPDASTPSKKPTPGAKGTCNIPGGSTDGEKTPSVTESPLGQRAMTERDTKERCNSSSPRVMSAMARFQVRDLHTGRAQTRGSPEQVRPGAGPRTWDTALRKTPWDAATPHSANGVMTASTTAEDPQDAPLVKVSELKKRFEQ